MTHLRLLGALVVAVSLAAITAWFPFTTQALYPTKPPGIMFLVVSTPAVLFLTFCACLFPAKLWREWQAFRPSLPVAVAMAVVGSALLYLAFGPTREVAHGLGRINKVIALPAALGLLAAVVGWAALFSIAIEPLVNAAASVAAAAPQRPSSRDARPAAQPTRKPTPCVLGPVRFPCGACGVENVVEARFAGRKGKCRRCRTVLRVPIAGAA